MKLKDLFEDNVNVNPSSSNSQFFKTYEETKAWLDKMGIENYKISKKTLVVDVGEYINLNNKNIEYIPVKFGEIDDWFSVSSNPNLKSLVGCPDSMKSILCDSNRIRDFNGLASVKNVIATNIKSLESFEGLPNELEYLNIENSCHNVGSLDQFPKIISGRLTIGQDFKWVGSLYKHMEMCGGIYLINGVQKYGDILKLLYVKGVNGISSNTVDGKTVTSILNAEIKRQPDPRKRNILKVAQELSNAGYHHLTV